MNHRYLFFAAALLSCCTSMAAEPLAVADAPASVVDGVAMPGVAPGLANAIPNAKPPARGSELDLRPKSAESGVIVARFGETQVLAIGKDRMNRIVTPFEQLRVKLSQDDSTKAETDGSVLYLTTTLDEPVSLYLYDARDSINALSLVLVPKATLPVDLTLRVNDLGIQRTSPRLADSAEQTTAPEREEPYVTTIMRVFKELASGRIPAGYGLRMAEAGSPVGMPACTMPGLRIEPGQVVEGHSIVTYVGRVTNVTFAPVDVHESGCVGDGILAVAAWPETRLLPRQSSEIYIAVRRTDEPGSSFRPSVIGGGK